MLNDDEAPSNYTDVQRTDHKTQPAQETKNNETQEENECQIVTLNQVSNTVLDWQALMSPM
jgi:hypothetical protein